MVLRQLLVKDLPSTSGYLLSEHQRAALKINPRTSIQLIQGKTY
jgi:hypothetical protein